MMRMRHVKGSDEAVASSPLVIQKPELYKGKWRTEIFRNDHQLHLEIGMGMGSFIRTQSFLNPDINYIGFEINTTVLYKAMCRYEKEFAANKGTGAPADHNLRFIRRDARFLTDCFAAGEVDLIYLNFSDPWPKDKNANKRLTSPDFLKRYDCILDKHGVIEFKTDNRLLFDYSLLTLSQCGWHVNRQSFNLHHDPSLNEGNIMTEYEAKFSAKGNPICKLIAGR